MKAIVFDEPGGQAKMKDIPEPSPDKGEVLVRIYAASLNRRDLWIKDGIYQGSKYPCVVGSDGSGIVQKTGEGVDSSLISTEVIINPGLGWGTNPGHHGENFTILGLPAQGTLAEYVCVPVENIYEKPKWLSFEQSAALPLAGLTAYRALYTRGQLKKDENLLITGIGGGVAMFLLKFGIATGANVFVTSSSEKKIKKAVNAGAKSGVLYTESNWEKLLMEQTENEGFDIIVDSAAGANFAGLLSLLKVGGRIVNFGGTAGKIPELTAAKIFWKQATIYGTTMGSPQDFESMLRLVETEKLQPEIDKIFPIEDTELAFKHMKNQEQFGKIVVRLG